jgi:hypothetical protein
MVDQFEEYPNGIEAMFVQIARGMTSSYRAVTFHCIAPLTLLFSDRPERVVGHVHTNKFISEWGEGESSFAEDPPNAVICFLEDGDVAPERVTVVLSYPQLDADTLTYAVDVLEGRMPARAGSCSVFIDPIGRPLSATSAAGMRRRQRRRVYRRI